MNQQLSMFSPADLGLAPPKARPVELWRTDHGSILLHHPTSKANNDWIEIAPEAISWLMSQLAKELPKTFTLPAII